MIVIFGSVVARTAAPSVVRGVGRSVGAAVRLATLIPEGAVVRGGGVVGAGGTVGASVRNGSVAAGVASATRSGSGVAATGGWSGAFGFFGCARAYVVDASRASAATRDAATRKAQAGSGI